MSSFGTWEEKFWVWRCSLRVYEEELLEYLFGLLAGNLRFDKEDVWDWNLNLVYGFSMKTDMIILGLWSIL